MYRRNKNLNVYMSWKELINLAKFLCHFMKAQAYREPGFCDQLCSPASLFVGRDNTNPPSHRTVRVTTNGNNSKVTIIGYVTVGSIKEVPSIRKLHATCIHVCEISFFILEKSTCICLSCCFNAKQCLYQIETFIGSKRL